MKALSVLALIGIASPAFAQVSTGKQSVPVQDQKPFLYDGLMPKDSSPPAPVDNPVTTLTIGGSTITPPPSTAQPLPASPQPFLQSPKTSAG